MHRGKLFNALALGAAAAETGAMAPGIGQMIADTVRGKRICGVYAAPGS
jgi:hypothetical protein